MKKSYVIFISAIACTACLIALVVRSNSLHQSLTLAATLLSAVAAVITMILALCLFDRFGVEQDLLRRQFDSVCSLLDSLRMLRLRLEATDRQSILTVRPLDPFPHPIFEQFYDYPVAFEPNALSIFKPLSDHVDDIFLPTSIARAVERLVPISIGATSDDDALLPRVLRFVLPRDSATGGDRQLFLRFNNRKLTFFEFLNDWANLVNTIDQWLRQNATVAPTLNIRHLSRQHFNERGDVPEPDMAPESLDDVHG